MCTLFEVACLQRCKVVNRFGPTPSDTGFPQGPAHIRALVTFLQHFGVLHCFATEEINFTGCDNLRANFVHDSVICAVGHDDIRLTTFTDALAWTHRRVWAVRRWSVRVGKDTLADARHVEYMRPESRKDVIVGHSGPRLPYSIYATDDCQCE
ncbi:hypothetical protein [Pectobacterium phage PEAT2]|uniref:Uncharacterized protein n=1 Tax=Pectobacterium phage PEAT2 TaxID=2053078 RepID=A0A2H4N7E9_9CAUD|nr:hypothetical protein F8206_gp40 [Pectobacterium phage PEAT2]ATV25104.1 hypothetical protein [Pectobacterium phage PEAT2]